MLTVPQAGILELLGELGCLRKRHIGQFAAAKYGSRPEHVARMLAQLATMGKVQADDDFVMLPGRKPDFDVIRAVDERREELHAGVFGTGADVWRGDGR